MRLRFPPVRRTSVNTCKACATSLPTQSFFLVPAWKLAYGWVDWYCLVVNFSCWAGSVLQYDKSCRCGLFVVTFPDLCHRPWWWAGLPCMMLHLFLSFASLAPSRRHKNHSASCPHSHTDFHNRWHSNITATVLWGFIYSLNQVPRSILNLSVLLIVFLTW